MLLRTREQTSTAPSLVIEAAGQKFRQSTQFLHLDGIIFENHDLWLEVERRIGLMWACFKRFEQCCDLFDRKAAPISPKVRMLKAEVIETLSYGCVTLTLGVERFVKLRAGHHQVLLWVIDFRH